MIALTFCIIAVICNGQQPATQTDEVRTGSISGRVVNESGQPVIGATIFARAAGMASEGRSTTSNLEGNFQISGLENALYFVTAHSPAYVTPPREVDTINPTYRVGDSVRLEIVRGGVITGKVTDTNGDGIAGVHVRAFMVRDVAGKPTRDAVISLGEQQTDDRGVYRIYGLAPGTYLVQAGGAAGFGRASVNATDFDAPTYAPSSTRDTASEFQVRGGEEVTVDIRYRGEPGHSISGTVKMQGTFGATISLARKGDGVLPSSNSFQPAGARGFILSGVADGEYDLTAQEVISRTSPFPHMALSEPVHITVKGGDVSGVELIPKPLASIAGRINLDSSKLPECQNKKQPLFSETTISLSQNRKDSEVDQLALIRLFMGSTTPDKDGAFVIRNLRQGQYSFIPQFFARYWYLKSMTLTGATQQPGTRPSAPALKDASTNWTVLKSGERLTGLTITLSEGAASIRGEIAKAANAKLPSDLRVYLVPAEREKADDPLRYFTSDVGSDGTFSFSNLPPGKYFTLARQTQADSPTTNDKFRLPDSIEVRAKMRKAAESAKSEVELKPCQNLTDFSLRTN